MSSQANENETQVEGISLEDALIAIKIIRKALENRPFIKEGLFGPKFLELSRSQRIEELMTPRISVFYPDDQKSFECLFLRITGDEGPLVEAFFYPIEAAWSFLDEGRTYLNQRRPADWSDEQVENRAFEHAVDMMLIMIDNLYQRSKLMMDSFTMETIAQWYMNMDEDMLQYYSSKGAKLQRRKNRFLDEMLKFYHDLVRKMWKYQGQSRENWRKIQFVDEYDNLLKHWRRLVKMINDGELDWREYAKAGKYQDTPDDLIAKVWDVDRSSDESVKTKVSELALEHAARRVGLIKRTSVSEWAREKRKEGTAVSDYSIPQLFTFIQEGRDYKAQVERNQEVQRKIATYPTPEKETDSTLEKKRKSLEQKIDFIKRNTSELPESDGGSAMEQKA